MEGSRPLEPGFVGMRDAVYKQGDAKELTTSAEETNARWVEHFSEVYDAEITANPKAHPHIVPPKSNSLRDGKSCTIEALLDEDELLTLLEDDKLHRRRTEIRRRFSKPGGFLTRRSEKTGGRPSS